MDNQAFDLITTRKSLVAKNNALIQNSRFSLSLVENKALLYLISQIQPDDKAGKLYHFNCAKFQTLLNWNQKSSYINLKNMLKELADKSLWIDEEINGSPHLALLRWFNIVHIDIGNADIEISFHDDMFPYLVELKNRFMQNGSYFTSYKLENVTLMKHKYSIRIYELLKSYQNQSKWIFENGTGSQYDLQLRIADVKIDDKIKKPISQIPKSWANWAEFKRVILNPAVTEINKYTDIKVTFVGLREDLHHKKTKAVRTIVFFMVKKTETELTETDTIIDTEYNHIEDENKYHQMCLSEIEDSFFSEHKAKIDKEKSEKDQIEALLNESKRENSKYPILWDVLNEHGADFTEEQIEGLFRASVKNIPPKTIPFNMKEMYVTDYVTYYYDKVKATNEDTKTKPYNRLYDMVQKDYDNVSQRYLNRYAASL